MRLNLRPSLHFLLILSGLTGLRGQLADVARPLPDLPPPVFRRLPGGLELDGFSPSYGHLKPIEGIVLQLAAGGEPEVSFRFQDSAGEWSPWVQGRLFPEPFSNRYFATYRGPEVAPSLRFEYKVEVAQEPIEVLNAGVFLVDQEVYPEPGPRPRIQEGEVPRPRIISRQEWGAQPPQYDYRYHPYYDKLTLHHAAGFRADNLAEGIVQMRAIQEFHQEGRGWNDIGYHFVLDRAGNIYQGRPETVIGAHVGGANTGNIGVCVLGCYHPPASSYSCNDELTHTTEDSLIRLFAWIADTYGYDPQVLLGHRDYFGNTSCPGDNIWVKLPQLRIDITIYIEYGEQPLRVALFQNYPNPFNTTTTIHYDLTSNEPVQVTVYDLLGRPVRILVDGVQIPGYKTILWDGRNGRGYALGTGVYLYTLKVGDFTRSRKMVLLR